MGYDELVERLPNRKQEIDAICHLIARVFAEKREWIYFGSVRAPVARLKKKLGYVGSNEVIAVLGRVPRTGNIKNNIERELLLIAG
jgi:predicted AAA+ superfamily ATPase